MAKAQPLPDDFDWYAHSIKTNIKNMFSDPETWANGKEVECVICKSCGSLVEKSSRGDHYYWHQGLKRY